MTQIDTIFDFDLIGEAFAFANFDNRSLINAYLDRQTGTVLYFSPWGEGDFDEEPDDLEDTSRYIAIPDTRQFGLGSELAITFAEEQAPHLADEVSQIFRRRGGFQRFKALLLEMGLLDKWYQYQNEQEFAVILRWCRQNDIRHTPPEPRGK